MLNVILILLLLHRMHRLGFLSAVPNSRAPPVTVKGLCCEVGAVPVYMSARTKHVFQLLHNSGSVGASNIESGREASQHCCARITAKQAEKL